MTMKLEDAKYNPIYTAILRDENYELVSPDDPKAKYAEQYRNIDGELTHVVFRLDTGKPEIDDNTIT